MNQIHKYCTLLLILFFFDTHAQFSLGYEQVGIASFYHQKFQGRLTANGEIFRHDSLTAAHRTLPFGTMVELQNLANGRWIVVRINDRGPYAGNRMIDLTYRAAKKLGFTNKGLSKVKMTIVGEQGKIYLSSNNIIVDDNKEFIAEITKPASEKVKVPYKPKKKKIIKKKKKKTTKKKK